MQMALAKDNIDTCISLLQKALDEGAQPVAAFDADNTLWNTDVGEIYFEYIIDNKLVELPENPWDHYMSLRNGDNPPEGYLWLAQVMKGVPLEDAQTWSRKITEYKPIPVFESMQYLMEKLQSLSVKTYIVTASVKWAIEGAAQLYNIPPDQVLGVKTSVVDGKITDEQDGPITWKQGKAEAILQASGDKAPFFCAGNSSGDIYLLEAASHYQLAVQTVPEDHMIYESELELHKIALEKGYWTHDHR
ncbi:MAG: haloacid dehalogenase [Bdellovibrionaceae bacterium]|nr:haloacid dehalogenase [Pseudobdellovibrionaceae bacterium]|tara:strand:- start:32644 stop:33384 length:741 start_codon:yes stop_codon:yes gene_type:complete